MEIEVFYKILSGFDSRSKEEGLEVFASTRDQITIQKNTSGADVIAVPGKKINTAFQVEFALLRETTYRTICNCTISRKEKPCPHGVAACHFAIWKFKSNKDLISTLIREASPASPIEFLRYHLTPPKWKISSSGKIDWLDLTVSVSFGSNEISVGEIHRLITAKENKIFFSDGSIGVIPSEMLERYSMLFLIGEVRQNTIHLNKLHAHVLDNFRGDIEDDSLLRQVRDRVELFSQLGDQPIPKLVQDILRDYQAAGFQYLQKAWHLGWGVCLADDMGLGKTLQVLTFFDYLIRITPSAKILVVAPTTVIYNWGEEIKKFFPSFSYYVYYGQRRSLTPEAIESNNIFITSYGVVRLDAEILSKVEWTYIALDESHTIKNPDAAVTQAVNQIKATVRLSISGTPIQNNSTDAFSQYDFLNPGMLGSYAFFRNYFGVPIDERNDTKKLALLRQVLFPFTLRRTKEMVASELPEKTVTIRWCEMEGEQRALYEKYKAYYRNLIMERMKEKGVESVVGDFVFKALHELRQICDHPRLLKNAKETTDESSKLNEMLREIEDISSNHKIVVFSQFVEMLDIISEKLNERKYRHFYLHGAVTAERRQRMVEDFQNKEDTGIFLISLKAGGVGINLTRADYVFIYDPWWNPAVENQAIDRVHRIGQKSSVFAYKMICRDSVEEKILELQQRKKLLSEELTQAESEIVKKITAEDIKYVLE